MADDASRWMRVVVRRRSFITSFVAGALCLLLLPLVRWLPPWRWTRSWEESERPPLLREPTDACVNPPRSSLSRARLPRLPLFSAPLGRAVVVRARQAACQSWSRAW